MFQIWFNPLNAELNPVCHLLALLAHPIFHVSWIRARSTDSFFNVTLSQLQHLSSQSLGQSHCKAWNKML
jgi:hypothetical protein